MPVKVKTRQLWSGSQHEPSSGEASPDAHVPLTGAVKKLHARLCRRVGSAIADYQMIEEGDRIMVCVSGGKDSFGLLDILLSLRSRAPIRYELIAVNLDQKQPGFPAHVLPEYFAKRGVPFHIETRDTYSTVKRLVPEGETMCAVCSRLRRGILYWLADQLGATKIALGHHRDDIIETFLLNVFFNGKLRAMPPKLLSDDQRHVVIRPLAYVAEADLARYAALRRFPIIPCNLCGSQDNLQRKKIKTWLQEWERQIPECRDSLFAALGNVLPEHLLDRRLFDISSLRPNPHSPGDTGSSFEASGSHLQDHGETIQRLHRQ